MPYLIKRNSSPKKQAVVAVYKVATDLCEQDPEHILTMMFSYLSGKWVLFNPYIDIFETDDNEEISSYIDYLFSRDTITKDEVKKVELAFNLVKHLANIEIMEYIILGDNFTLIDGKVDPKTRLCTPDISESEFYEPFFEIKKHIKIQLT